MNSGDLKKDIPVLLVCVLFNENFWLPSITMKADQKFLILHLNVKMETTGVVSMTLPVLLSLLDAAGDWSSAKTWKTCNASHLSQALWSSHWLCDTPHKHCKFCPSLGVIMQNQSI